MKLFKGIWIFLLINTVAVPFIFLQAQHSHRHEQKRENRYRTRLYWQMPNRVLDAINVKEGMVVADLGAGDGYFTFVISKRVGEMGKVYASDIDNHALQVIRDRCREEGLENISVVLGTEDDPKLPEKTFDIVLMVNTIHLVKNPSILLKHVAGSLKPGGYLVIVQWDTEKMAKEVKNWDLKDQARYTLRTNLRTIYAAGFEVVQIKDFLPMQRIYLCLPAKN